MAIPANADGRKSALPMDARARKPARPPPTTGSIAYLYPGRPACSPYVTARRALGALPRKTRPPRPSEPRGASRVSALPASATNAARRGPRARRAVRRDVPCVPRPSTQPEPVPFESPASSLRADGVRRVAFWRLRRARLTRAQATFLKAKNVPKRRSRENQTLVRGSALPHPTGESKSRSPQDLHRRRILESRTQDDSNSENLTHARSEVANENPSFPRELI